MQEAARIAGVRLVLVAVVSITASAQVTPLTIGESFAAVAIPVGRSTSLTLTLSNPNPTTATHIDFTDFLTGGLVLTTGMVGSCGGGTITAVPGTASISLVNATLAARASCSFSVNVVGRVEGSLTNTTSAVQATVAATTINGPGATATLVVGDSFQISYLANLEYADSAIDITNSGSSASAFDPETQISNGNMCVNVYAFTPDEQMLECCSCYVTPNALRSFSALSDMVIYTNGPSTPMPAVVKLVATLAGPGGASGPGTATAPTCNAAIISPGPAGSANSLALGLAAWSTHVQGLGPTAVLPPDPTPGVALGLTEVPFTPGTLAPAELQRLTALCNFLQADGSGFGICNSCRLGGLGGVRQ